MACTGAYTACQWRGGRTVCNTMVSRGVFHLIWKQTLSSETMHRRVVNDVMSCLSQWRVSVLVARLDESKYTVLRNHPVGSDFEHQELPEAVGSSNRRKLSSANQDTEAAISFGNAVNSSGGSLKNSSSMSRTPHSSLATDKSSHALAGARFYIDSDLPLDLQLKVSYIWISWCIT